LVDILSPLILSFMAAMSGAVVPGPVFVITVSESLKKGVYAGPLIVVGHLLLEILIIIAISLGLGIVLSSHDARLWIAYIGGAMLIVMGLFLAKAAKGFKTDVNLTSSTHLVSHGLVVAGILSSGSNPQFFPWWIATGIPTIQYSLAVAGAIGFAAFLIGHAAADLFWFSFIGYSAHKGKKFLGRKAIQAILFSSALFMMIFGFSYIHLAYFTTEL